eukprot:GSMAST32.ASY1.ANO1.2514.1 assembled CDS
MASSKSIPPVVSKEIKRTPACIVLGMAGAGKTTLMQRLNAFSRQVKKPAYMINLDPAVMHLPYDAQIDIRDTVNYKELMQQYKLGPNGGIMTALNLFVTKFDQVLSLMEKRSAEADYLMLDTPGQIEVFTCFPTVLIYVIDTPRCTTQMPMVIVFNKVDVTSHDFAIEWMQDFEAFQEALTMENDDSYMSSLLRSMSMCLDEFYAVFECVGVSSTTGAGIGDFFDAVDRAARRFDEEVKPRMDAQKKKIKEEREAAKQKELEKMSADLAAAKAKQNGGMTGACDVGKTVVLQHDSCSDDRVRSEAEHLRALNAELDTAGDTGTFEMDSSTFSEGRLFTDLEGECDEEERSERAEYTSLMNFVKKTAKEKDLALKTNNLHPISEEK